jgi:glycosyltransferase involved in cell wall biosynthesis
VIFYSLERIAAACSDAELLQNVEDVDVLRMLRVPEDRIHVLGNGIDLGRFDPDRADPQRTAQLRASFGAGPDDVVCGVVGRLVWEKGYREVFEAATRLRTIAPSVRVVVVGPSEPSKEDAVSEVDIARAERDGGIRFLGMRDDLEEIYPAMDVNLLASYREGFPRAAMEAAAMGKPLVVTDVRGCRQVVDDGVTGKLVPVRDATALADAVASLARDPATRAAMGAAGREKARREFDDRTSVAITLGVYEQLLGPRKPAAERDR